MMHQIKIVEYWSFDKRLPQFRNSFPNVGNEEYPALDV